ncbi:MAG: 6-carboxytetrahydropterin synthase [Calditrichaeota bacterium]|nr:MAG: 6-carboxytetrahydropterin synthase [Calditrichota bacterium]MBL1205102.1 6-carboxytetrahydropterin synthase [Calditrichota bacterium]NOG44932.1 6-carboxytetrahydropterin synthase [Calditrichota bacterium]
MQKVTISRKFEFSASHRYWREEWSEEKNKEAFGLCISPHGHGHNYELHVTITGDISPETGMIVNLTVLKSRVKNILNQFDHKYLNLDTDYFNDKIPTTENIALVLFKLIDEDLSKDGYELVRIRLYERHDLYAEVWK